MNINQMVVDAFKEVEIGRRFTTKEIIEFVEKKYPIKRGSFLPSDMCHNRTNKGIEKTPSYCQTNSRIFIWESRGNYVYVGPNYKMNRGKIINDHRN